MRRTLIVFDQNSFLQEELRFWQEQSNCEIFKVKRQIIEPDGSIIDLCLVQGKDDLLALSGRAYSSILFRLRKPGFPGSWLNYLSALVRQELSNAAV